MKRSLALALAAFLGLGLLSTTFAGFAQDAFHCLARMAQDSAALSLRGRFLRISFDSPRRFPAGFFLSASKPRWPLPRSSDLHVQSLPRRETGGVFLSVWKTRACI